MITEDYVSFEVAKLLKEKGFNEKCRTFYNDKTLKITNIDSSINNEKPFNLCLLAPTLQMALKWLREIHNLHIDVFIGITEDATYTYWTYFITDLKGNMIVNAYGEDIDFKGENYEKTVENAIKYCLTSLIK